MKCPYCASEIADEALVCAVCQRDLFLVKPLLERIASLEQQLLARPVPVDEGAGVRAADAAEAVQESVPVDEYRISWALISICLLTPLLLLVLGHWLIVFVYDAKVLYLRIFALLLPLPFGFFHARSSRFSLALGAGSAFVMAGLAVFGMSAVTAWLDGTPVLPQNMLEIREFLEFAASIGFSFLTGFWLHCWSERRQVRQHEVIERLRAAGVGGLEGGVSDSLARWNDFGSAAVAFATTLMSIYTGLKGLVE